jgi:hypothetical protein
MMQQEQAYHQYIIIQRTGQYSSFQERRQDVKDDVWY